MAARIIVGTSSWADPGFVEEWYPPGMPARDRLGWYAQRFDCVEVNSSFYAIQEPGMVARWAEVTPDGFVFDYKLHRVLSRHAAERRLAAARPARRPRPDPRGRVRLTPGLERALVERTLEAVKPLEQAGKLGAFLLQLTPSFSPERHEPRRARAACWPRSVRPPARASSSATAAGSTTTGSRTRSSG